MINTRRDIARTHCCPVGLVFLFLEVSFSSSNFFLQLLDKRSVGRSVWLLVGLIVGLTLGRSDYRSASSSVGQFVGRTVDWSVGPLVGLSVVI